jgi:hypothetical protein
MQRGANRNMQCKIHIRRCAEGESERRRRWQAAESERPSGIKKKKKRKEVRRGRERAQEALASSRGDLRCVCSVWV